MFLDEAHAHILADFCPLRLRLQNRQRTNGSSQRFKVREEAQLSPLSLGNFQHWNLVSSHFPPMHGYHYPVIRSTPSLGRKIMWKHSEITKNFLLRSAGQCGKVVSFRQEFCWSDAPWAALARSRFVLSRHGWTITNNNGSGQNWWHVTVN